MKKMLLSFLLLFFCFALMAQDAKPTKEQTVEYITNKLKNSFSDYIRKDGVSVSEVVKDVSWNNCSLTISIYRVNNSIDEYTPEYVINLSQIEQISFAETSGVCFLKFLAYNSKELIKVTTNSKKNGIKRPESKYSSAEISFSVPKEEKLVQAFNHLRKLCGAPEPIKF